MGAVQTRDGAEDSSAGLEEMLGKLNRGEFDLALRAVSLRQRRLHWERLPEKIVLLRHGESEGNVNKTIYTSKGDALLELTPRGLAQAGEAGQRLRGIVGDSRIFGVVSPFERTQQTLLGLYRGGFPEEQVATVHVSSQIREQEFGNFQTVGLNEAAKAEQVLVGRFYYRRPNAESSADVYDRVAAFWDELLNDLLVRETYDYGTCVIVTHGLTMRLMLMKIFQWSVETFETVWNVGNCHHITVRKDLDNMCYKLCKASSYPAQNPWATRHIWLTRRSKGASPETEEKLRRLQAFKESKEGSEIYVAMQRVASESSFSSPCAAEYAAATTLDRARIVENRRVTFGKSEIETPTFFWPEIDRAIDNAQNQRMRERSEPYTVLDYLAVPQPRTMQRIALRLVPGHGHLSREAALRAAEHMQPMDWDDVEFIDWWGSVLSYQAKMLRITAGVWGQQHPDSPTSMDSSPSVRHHHARASTLHE